MVRLRKHHRIQLVPQVAHPKGDLVRQSIFCVGSTETEAQQLLLRLTLTVSQPEVQPHAQMGQQKPKLNYNRRVNITYLEHSAQMTKKTATGYINTPNT